MVGQSEGAVSEGAAEIGDGGAPDEAGVVEGQMRFGLGEVAAVEVGEGRWRHEGCSLLLSGVHGWCLVPPAGPGMVANRPRP